MVADGQFEVLNGNGGLQDHDYYDRERYQSKFEVIWEKLQTKGLARSDWRDLRNSDLFKYSPYKTLTDDQYLVVDEILSALNTKNGKNFLVNGGPGTGKTIVATYLMKQLVDKGNKNIALVIAMTPLRKTLKKVFRSIPGLSASMVVGPADTVNHSYDVVLVDEAHRLRRRKNIPNYGSFDEVNRKLGFNNDADELDWIQARSKQVILFYDNRQSVRPSDILPEKINNLDVQSFTLETQMRVKGGYDYLTFVDQLLEGEAKQNFKSSAYDFKYFDNFTRFIAALKHKKKEHSLCRLVAGYGWEWKSKTDKTQFDIEIDGHKLFWNSKLSDWVNSPNAPSEVGCIHTIQGYDLNYTGVIIGPELSYDPVNKEILVLKDNYKDANGHRGVSDPEELKRYVINIYKTLMTRGILGTYVYVVDEELKNYLEEITSGKSGRKEVIEEAVESPYVEVTTSLPLYDSIGCGEATYADPVSVEQIEIPQSLVKPGAKYFVLRTSGDSMNKLGIEDGDLILCQKNYQATSGSNAVVLIGDDATLKEIKYEKDGLLLIPHSTNTEHQEIKLGEEDDFKVLGTFVRRLDLGLE
jgi:hypothetical protein